MHRHAAPALALIAAFALVALGASFVAIGCATSASDAQTHGPVFPFDANAPNTSDAGSPDDATTPITNEASTDEASTNDDASDSDANDAATNPSSDAGDAAACGSPIAVLAGSGSSLVGAIAIGTGAFTTQTITGSALSAPQLVATSAGFEALVAMNVDAGGGGALDGFGLTGTTWSSPAALGPNASAVDAPAIAAMGSTVQGVYLNPQHFYFHAQQSGSSWDTGADEVLTTDGGVQSFGPVRASAAATATELVIAYEGNDLHLYVQSWTSAGGWKNAIQIGSDALGTNLAPAIVALAGSTSNLVVVYNVAGNATSNFLKYALRDGTQKTWSSPAPTNANAYSPYQASLAPMSGGRAVVGWRGGNNLPYTMELTTSGTPGWTVPAQLAAVTVNAAPSLATGTCGSDAVAAIVSSGAVTLATDVSGAWTPRTPSTGITGATFAAIATSP